MPLAIGAGVGAEIRRPLGVAIVGGLILSQMLTLFTTPVVYIYMDRFQSYLRRTFQKSTAPRHAPAHSD
jgi:multidrug efflux pump